MTSILNISNAASIALHSMIILAQNQDKLVSVKKIAGSLDISDNHLSKVLQRLTKAGLVSSIKGYKGGFKLNQSPEKINFLEIYEAIDGKLCSSSCLLNKESCNNQCIMGSLLANINTQVKDFFEKTKLIDFIK